MEMIVSEPKYATFDVTAEYNEFKSNLDGKMDDPDKESIGEILKLLAKDWKFKDFKIHTSLDMLGISIIF